MKPFLWGYKMSRMDTFEMDIKFNRDDIYQARLVIRELQAKVAALEAYLGIELVPASYIPAYYEKATAQEASDA